jgi:hypothetical protein
MARLVASDVESRIGKSIEIVETKKSENLNFSFDLNTDRLQGLGIRIEDGYKLEFDRLHDYFKQKIAIR